VGSAVITKPHLNFATIDKIVAIETTMSEISPAPPRLWREIQLTFVLALPIVFGQLSSMAMNIIDTGLAGHYHPTTMAAIGIGAPAWSVVILICIGVLMAISPSVAQLHGARRRQEIGALFRQATWLALFLGLALFFIVRAIPLSFEWIGITASVRPEANDFIYAISWGAPALALYFCFRNMSEGIGWTWPTLLFGLLGLVLLAPLGYVLMFTFKYGAAGLGAAIAIVLWLQAACFYIYLHREPHYADLDLFVRFDWPQWAPIAELLKLGLPMGVSVFMEGSLFVITAALVGRFGVVSLAAHQAAILAASLTFMIPLGVAMATTVRIGHAVGAKEFASVRKIAYAGYVIALISQTLSGIVLVFAGAWLAGLITQDAAVISLAATLMIYAAVFQYPDGMQALSNGALRGLKDTRWPMILTIFAYWGVGIPLGYYIGIHQNGGVFGLWQGLIMGLTVASGLLTWRFWRMTRHYHQMV
jgi:multidrug resistance protein, MATE family